MFDFDFIECFTTTFLRAHSWLNWVDEDDDEDEVGLKEKPEDTIDTSKRLHQNKTRSTGRARLPGMPLHIAHSWIWCSLELVLKLKSLIIWLIQLLELNALPLIPHPGTNIV